MARDVGAALDELETAYAGLKGLVRNEGGSVHRHINIYVNGDAIEALQGLSTPLKHGDEVTIIPALAGGGRRWSMIGAGPRVASSKA